jgi:subtilase family serine protease
MSRGALVRISDLFRSRKRYRTNLAGLASLLAVSTFAFGVATPAEPAGAVVISATPIRVGEAPFVPRTALPLGPVAASSVMTVDVVLEPRDPAALASYANAVSTPGSPLYRHYLAAGAFPAMFGPRAATIESVAKWLRGQGLRPEAISSDHLYFRITATAAQLEHAFSVDLVRYRLGGRIVYTNTAGPLFGRAVAGAIQDVIGLDNIELAQHESMFPIKELLKPRSNPHVVTGGPQPCSAAVTAAQDSDSYTADQLASAYKFSSLYGDDDLGAGQEVALLELEPNLPSDISAYQSCYGTNTSVTYTEVDGGSGSGAGSGEAALDIEDVVGLAPEAEIDVYQAPNSFAGIYDDYGAIVSADTQQVVSTSWGLCEPLRSSSLEKDENVLFETAAAQGQSVFAAAGDDGSEDCYSADDSDHLAVDDPASQPYVTGVGGTTLSALGPLPTQKAWNDSSRQTGASGGGLSSQWAMPFYQSGAPSSLHVINSHSSGTPCGASAGSYCREVADVSADADPYTGYLIYYDGSWGGIGGTSGAAPLWAAFMALTNASTGCGGTAVGFANPDLYKIAGSSSYSTTFSDITAGNNDYTPSGNLGGLYRAGTGYDMASGLGTPIGSGLPAALCAVSGDTVTVTNPGRQTTEVGTKASLQITATDSDGLSLTYSSSGLPDGLKLNATTGLITGKPKKAGTSTVTVTAVDTTGGEGGATFTWKVSNSLLGGHKA